MPIRAVNWPATRRPPADPPDDAQPFEVSGTRMPISLLPVRDECDEDGNAPAAAVSARATTMNGATTPSAVPA